MALNLFTFFYEKMGLHMELNLPRDLVLLVKVRGIFFFAWIRQIWTMFWTAIRVKELSCFGQLG